MSASPGQIVAAVLLPPLGVYLARGPGRDFLIACGLTVLGFLPGMVWALWTVLRGDAAATLVHRQPQPASAVAP